MFMITLTLDKDGKNYFIRMGSRQCGQNDNKKNAFGRPRCFPEVKCQKRFFSRFPNQVSRRHKVTLVEIEGLDALQQMDFEGENKTLGKEK